MLDTVRAATGTYKARLQMFEDAQSKTEKTKHVPTYYAIEAKKDALFPGVTVDEARADIPWDLQVADTIKSFPVPYDEEIEFLRCFSPLNSFPNTVALELTTNHYHKEKVNI